MEISVSSYEGPGFSRIDNNEIEKYIDEIEKSSQEPLSQFQPNWAQSIFLWKGFNF